MTEVASVEWWRVVPESAVLWRDCDECGGKDESADGWWCKRPNCVDGRVRVGVCWIEPDEAGRLRNGIMEELHWGLDGIISPDLVEMTDRILTLFGVKEQP